MCCDLCHAFPIVDCFPPIIARSSSERLPFCSYRSPHHFMISPSFLCYCALMLQCLQELLPRGRRRRGRASRVQPSWSPKLINGKHVQRYHHNPLDGAQVGCTNCRCFICIYEQPVGNFPSLEQDHISHTDAHDLRMMVLNSFRSRRLVCVCTEMELAYVGEIKAHFA